jgi:hypothetical protein
VRRFVGKIVVMHASCPKKKDDRRRDNDDRTQSTRIDIVVPL